MRETHTHAWVGIDAGKGHHWAAVVDEAGLIVWSHKIINDETATLHALSEILALADELHWAVDISGTSSALLLALLAAHDQSAVYVPGRTVNRMSGAYRGEAKTDARDAYVIAETARHRHDLSVLIPPAQLAAELALLTSHRTDLVADRVRLINRLRDTLTGVFPALERAFDFGRHKGALVLLTGFQTPRAIRRRGRTRLSLWLGKRGVRGADGVAEIAWEAASAQNVVLPGEAVAAQLVADIADRVLAVDVQLARIDARSVRPSAAIRRLRSSNPCPVSVRSSARNSLSLPVICRRTPMPDTLPRQPVWFRSPAIPVAEPATCTDPNATAGDCGGSSTSPLKPRSSKMDRIASSTSRNEVKE
ncbi:hypothetical protein RQN9TF_31865 (plasmid) [Rhodococcus qingshengii]|nr:hypothetical protein RQN9TF_31865 [Rhodococcus qingshengii]